MLQLTTRSIVFVGRIVFAWQLSFYILSSQERFIYSNTYESIYFVICLADDLHSVNLVFAFFYFDATCT